MPDAPLRLRVDGGDYAGWKTVRVERSIEAIVGAFELSVSERYPGQPQARPIRPGQSCEVWIGSERVISGYVDEVSVSFDATTHSISVRGRDKALDLIDSAPDLSPGSWMKVTVLELARILSEPFGVSVRADAPVGLPFETVALTPGQKPWELIEERCRYRQLLPISDGAGGIVLTRAGSALSPVALVEGQNMLSASGEFSHAERFRDYTVKGQSTGGDEIGAELSIFPSGKARDPEIKRHRPLLVVPTSSVDPERCQQRASWEAIFRAARGDRVSVVVQGWQQPNERLWPVNARAQLRSPTLGIDGELLISSVTYLLDEQGSRTELSLVRPDAFTPPPDAEPPEMGLGFAEIQDLAGVGDSFAGE